MSFPFFLNTLKYFRNIFRKLEVTYSFLMLRSTFSQLPKHSDHAVIKLKAWHKLPNTSIICTFIKSKIQTSLRV